MIQIQLIRLVQIQYSRSIKKISKIKLYKKIMKFIIPPSSLFNLILKLKTTWE